MGVVLAEDRAEGSLAGLQIEEINGWMGKIWRNTVDGRNPAPVDMVNIPLVTGFLHPGWCRISSIYSRGRLVNTLVRCLI